MTINKFYDAQATMSGGGEQIPEALEEWVSKWLFKHVESAPIDLDEHVRVTTFCRKIVYDAYRHLSAPAPAEPAKESQPDAFLEWLDYEIADHDRIRMGLSIDAASINAAQAEGLKSARQKYLSLHVHPKGEGSGDQDLWHPQDYSGRNALSVKPDTRPWQQVPSDAPGEMAYIKTTTQPSVKPEREEGYTFLKFTSAHHKKGFDHFSIWMEDEETGKSYVTEFNGKFGRLLFDAELVRKAATVRKMLERLLDDHSGGWPDSLNAEIRKVIEEAKTWNEPQPSPAVEVAEPFKCNKYDDGFIDEMCSEQCEYCAHPHEPVTIASLRSQLSAAKEELATSNFERNLAQAEAQEYRKALIKLQHAHKHDWPYVRRITNEVLNKYPSPQNPTKQ